MVGAYDEKQDDWAAANDYAQRARYTARCVALAYQFLYRKWGLPNQFWDNVQLMNTYATTTTELRKYFREGIHAHGAAVIGSPAAFNIEAIMASVTGFGLSKDRYGNYPVLDYHTYPSTFAAPLNAAGNRIGGCLGVVLNDVYVAFTHSYGKAKLPKAMQSFLSINAKGTGIVDPTEKVSSRGGNTSVPLCSKRLEDSLGNDELPEVPDSETYNTRLLLNVLPALGSDLATTDGVIVPSALNGYLRRVPANTLLCPNQCVPDPLGAPNAGVRLANASTTATPAYAMIIPVGQPQQVLLRPQNAVVPQANAPQMTQTLAGILFAAAELPVWPTFKPKPLTIIGGGKSSSWVKTRSNVVATPDEPKKEVAPPVQTTV